MRAQHAFSAARPDKGDALGDFVGGNAERRDSASVNASVAKPRVKSLAPPLPSVLPIKATISSWIDRAAVDQPLQPETSLGLFIGNLCTAMRISAPRGGFQARRGPTALLCTFMQLQSATTDLIRPITAASEAS